jgi:hypothetical protein
VLLLASRILAGIAGAFFIWAALLLTEKEHKDLDKWLDDRWRQLKMAERPLDERLRYLVVTSFSLVNDVADAILGPRLLSLRAFASSFAISSASFFVVLGSIATAPHILPVGLVHAVFVLVALRRRLKPAVLTFGTAFIWWLVGVMPAAALSGQVFSDQSPAVLYVVLNPIVTTLLAMVLALPGYAWDVGFVAMARHVVRFGAATTNLAVAAGLAVGIVVVGAVGAVPVVLVAFAEQPFFLLVFWLSNWGAMLLSAIPVATIALLLTQKLLHPLLATRVFERLRSIDRAKRGKFLLAMGSALLTWTFKPSWLAEATKVLEKLAG